ncbi:FMN-binding negative transcriptional regulator [Nitratireductor sp. CAU 1489]|uniref:FMN-binding negative transcriptional regulator n=1 Tax=Nitratireductor arenosus TaxID=2682096 RepID=A0A844QE80_9HYPH|nr:FMN-binding negative transcriptional regulator [Nitratireductor arenosus]MVA97307.1 FMN-binding negative transcriptional regulator [Nitratireductor arenosus]
MYQPPHFREQRLDVLHDLIRAHPLGLLVTAGPQGPVADPLPFLLDVDRGGNGTLRAHLSRANPHWRLIVDRPQRPVLAVFQGANAYVTPSWYATKRETGKVVPTWNYAIVQARGRPAIIEDRDWLARQIGDLTRMHEDHRAEPWAVSDAPQRFVDAQIGGIVGLEIEIASIEGKWKVSQNRSEVDRLGVAAGLESETAPDAQKVAGLVRAHSRREG